MRQCFANSLLGDYYQCLAHTARLMSPREIDMNKVTEFVNCRNHDLDLEVTKLFARDLDWPELQEWCRLRFGWTATEDLKRFTKMEDPDGRG